MSKKTHERELARARAKRAAERAQQRRRRNIVLGIVAFVALVAAGLGLAAVLGGDDDPDVAIDDPVATDGATDGATGDPTDAAAGPCPAPTDAPEPDTSLQYDAPPDLQLEEGVDYQARIETTCGTIVVDLAEDESPGTVNNFVFLASEGFYRGVPFHRISADFVIQGGDPTGTGTGGPGYRFDDELDLAEQLVAENDGMYPRGTLAMANSGPNTNGSQFFIVQADPGYPFEPDYAAFGMVVEGMDVVDDIANGPVTGTMNDQAVDPARIVSVEIVEQPAEEDGDDAAPSDEPTGPSATTE